MSYHRDYIMRMLEMLADLIAGILGLIRKGNYVQASESLDQAYQDYLKHDAAFFWGLSEEEMTTYLITEHNYTNGHLEILAELFYAEAELKYAEGKKAESLPFYRKALKLQEYILSEGRTYSPQKESRMQETRKRIEELA